MDTRGDSGGYQVRRLVWSGLVLSSLMVPLLAGFGSILFADRQFAFQDAGHFYYPLLERVQQEWNAGRWPLWSPEAGAGTPLLGNPTAAVLYPFKVIFALLPFPWAMRVYVIGHVVLAFGAMLGLLRWWGVSVAGSLLGALAYAFGVPVLSQTSNMIFLVGAAWAPLGLLAADGWVRGGKRWALPALALVLALQVLGGDPESAYLTVIAAVGYAAGLTLSRKPPSRRAVWLGLVVGSLVYVGLLGLSWWSARAIQVTASSREGSAPPWKPPITFVMVVAWGVLAYWIIRRARRGPAAREFRGRAGGVIAAAALGLALSGAQLFPILEYTGMSFRAAAAEGYHDVFAYSARPLQFLDAVWPSCFGTSEAGYRSWINALPPKPESRLWMPSVYLGGLTLVMALAGFGWKEGPAWRSWMSGVALVCLLAALGYHGGPLHWARCVPGAASVLGPLEQAFNWQVRADGALRDGDGGVYWLLAMAFPGFGSFRYPPKLLVFWSLGMAALAGAGWDRIVGGRSRWACGLARGLFVLSMIGCAGAWIGGPALRAGFERLAATRVNSDEPIDVERALADLRTALLHGVVVFGVVFGVLRQAERRPAPAGVSAVIVLVADLCVANAYHVVSVPQAAFEGVPRALAMIQEAEASSPASGPYRVARVGRWWPSGWPADAPRDFERITRWERNSLRPNFGLPLGVQSTFYFDTIEPFDYGLFFLPWTTTPDSQALRSQGLAPGQKVWYFPRRGFDLWNTRYFIVPARLVWGSSARGYAAMVPNSTFLYPKPGTFDGPDGLEMRKRWGATEDFRVLRNEAAFPRAWVVHRARVLPKVRGLSVLDRGRTMREMLYQADEFWRIPGAVVHDPRGMAWVESDRPAEVERFLSRADPDPSEVVKVERDEPQRVELSATLNSPGLVVICDRYAPGWRLTVDGKTATILRTNRAMRGVALAAGTHHLEFVYDPWSFRFGSIVSMTGLTILAALGAWAARGAFPTGGTRVSGLPS